MGTVECIKQIKIDFAVRDLRVDRFPERFGVARSVNVTSIGSIADYTGNAVIRAWLACA